MDYTDIIDCSNPIWNVTNENTILMGEGTFSYQGSKGWAEWGTNAKPVDLGNGWFGNLAFNCRNGILEGENINYKYCSNFDFLANVAFRVAPSIVSENGVIIKNEKREAFHFEDGKIYFVFNPNKKDEKTGNYEVIKNFCSK